MTLKDLILLFDEQAVSSGKIAFTFHEPKGGKWNFWSSPDSPCTREQLADHIMSYPSLAGLEIEGFEETSLEPWDEDGLRVRITFP